MVPSSGQCSEFSGVSALLSRNLSDVAPLLLPTSCDAFSALLTDPATSTLDHYDPATPCPPLFARNNGYGSPPPLPPRVPAAQDSGFNSYEEDHKEEIKTPKRSPNNHIHSLSLDRRRNNSLKKEAARKHSFNGYPEEIRRLSSSADLEELARLAKISDLAELRRLTSLSNLQSEKNVASCLSSASSSSSDFWTSESPRVTPGLRFQTMHSYPGEEAETDEHRRRRKVSIDLKYKRKPKVSNMLYQAADVAVKLNSPVPVETKLSKKKKEKTPKKGTKLKNALVNPLDVAINVNTPDNVNINFDAFQDYSRDIHPELPRSRRKPLVKSGLIAPLNVAVNVNTPANVKYPLNQSDIPRKRTSTTRPLSDSQTLVPPVFQRLESNTSIHSGEKTPCPSDSSTPKVVARNMGSRASTSSDTGGEEPLKPRKFNGRQDSVFTLSGCSESSCSSIDDLSDTDDPEYKTATIKPMAAYGGLKKSKSGTLTSIKSSKNGKGSRMGSLKNKKRDNRRPSVCDGLFGAMGVAIKVNTPADATKVREFYFLLRNVLLVLARTIFYVTLSS